LGNAVLGNYIRTNHNPMLHNYFIIGWRNILRNKLFSAINIAGLSIGITFTMLTAVYIWQEMQVNHQLKNAGNQYILLSKWKDPNMGYEIGTCAPLPLALKKEYPNLVKNYYRWDGVTSNVSKGDKHFREHIQIGDSTLLNMYGFKLLTGNAATAFNDPFSVVITRDKAIKYFGRTNVIGETITIESFKGDKHDFMVSGVLDKIPKNSITNLSEDNNNDLFLSLGAARFMGRDMDTWANTIVVGLVELQPGASKSAVDAAMLRLVKAHAQPQVAANLVPYIVPLNTYYLDWGPKKMLYTLGLVAAFILFMAIINFVNICISRSAQRMKEMGIRKVLGGLRGALIKQFLTESVIMVTVATLFAIVLYMIGRYYFADILQTEMTGLFGFPWYFYLLLPGMALFTGILAGLYPAVLLSSLKSVDSLKGKLGSVKENITFRKVLIAFQFATAAIVMICAIIISLQTNLFFGKSLGYDKEHVLYAQLPRDWSKKGVAKMEGIRSRIAQLPQVKAISLSWAIPDGNYSAQLQAYKMSDDSLHTFTSQVVNVDNQYAAAYNLKLKAGEFFGPAYMASDSARVVINEKHMHALGFNHAADAIGQQFKAQGMPVLTICGVVQDFRFGSMQQALQPMTFLNVNYQPLYRFFSVKLNPGDLEVSINALQKKWSQEMPDAPFEYGFMDEALAKLYQTEIQLKKASYLATGLAIIIVLLGIIGLVSLSVQKRTKEIGVRKVLGSSAGNIVKLFLKDFLLTIAVSGAIACPVAFLLMRHWLNDYAYKISLTPMPFLISMVVLLVVTALLITLQTLKAAYANPVKSLRTE